jgi:hypothetical protein
VPRNVRNMITILPVGVNILIERGDLDTDVHLFLLRNIAQFTKFLGDRVPKVLQLSACSDTCLGIPGS